ncbi:MAG: helix-turn-helix domain-containing protein [Bacilli bacterium]|jgi:DNA-binding response OmpR family regulator|nr:helix-turn-helix domain-containing protein [Bacilli bacterium]
MKQSILFLTNEIKSNKVVNFLYENKMLIDFCHDQDTFIEKLQKFNYRLCIIKPLCTLPDTKRLLNTILESFNKIVIIILFDNTTEYLNDENPRVINVNNKNYDKIVEIYQSINTDNNDDIIYCKDENIFLNVSKKIFVNYETIIKLSINELIILEHLIKNNGKPTTKSQLSILLYPNNEDCDLDNTDYIYHVIKRIRKKIGTHFILTIQKEGYLWNKNS